jgi:hypothetical protein
VIRTFAALSARKTTAGAASPSSTCTARRTHGVRIHRLGSGDVLLREIPQPLDDGRDALCAAVHVLKELAQARRDVADLHLGEGTHRRRRIALPTEPGGALDGLRPGLELRRRAPQGGEILEDGAERSLDLVGRALGQLPQRGEPLLLPQPGLERPLRRHVAVVDHDRVSLAGIGPEAAEPHRAAAAEA